jgi:chitodextrinase
MRSCTFAGVMVLAVLLACRGEPDAAPRPLDAPARSVEAAPQQPVAVQPPAPADASDIAAPSAPGSLAARATSPSEISLTWTAAADDVAVTGYEVLRGGALVASERGLTRADGSLRPGQKYCYSVVALDGAGNRSPPATACASTPDVVAPSTPAAVTVVAKSDRVVAISWTASTDDAGVAAYEVYRGETRVAQTASLQATEGALAPAGRYCYAIEAVDGAGNRSPRSAPACADTPDLTPPSVPTNVIARGWGEHEIAVGWSASHDDVGVAGYELLNDGKVLAKAAETSASETGLEPWRERCYQVRAYDAAGNVSPPTKPVCARTHDLTPPSAQAPVATAVSDREIAIHWDASADNVAIAAYEVERHEGVVAKGGELEFSQKGLLPAKRYCFWVRATDPAGNKSERVQACATTPDLTPPSTPGRLAVAPRAATQVAAVWEAAQDDVGVIAYDVLRGDEVVASVTRTSAMLTNLAPQKEHCFTVRARDAAGNRSPVAGPFCATTPDVATPSGPANLRAELVPTGIQLQWEPSPSPGVVYAVYRDKDRRVGMTRQEAYTVSGALAGRGDCYRVAAVDDAGRESPKTFPACPPARVAVTAR